MNFLERIRLRIRAWRDARFGQYLGPQRFLDRYKACPQIDLEDERRAAERIGHFDGVLGQKTEAIKETQRGMTVLPSVQFLVAALLGVFLIENLAAFRILRTLGTTGGERVFLGLMLAVAVVGITYAVRSSIGRAADYPGMGHLTIATVVVVLYGILVAAIAAIRYQELAALDMVGVSLWGPVSITVALTVGPGWVMEHLIRLLIAALPLFRQYRIERRELEAIRRERGKIEMAVEIKRAELLAWHQTAEQARAIYDPTFRIAARDSVDVAFSEIRWPQDLVPHPVTGK